MKKKYLFMALAALGMASCSTDEIDMFDSNNYLSFQKSELSYTFAFEADDFTSKEFDLPVTFAGRYFDKDVQFSIVAVDEKSTAKEGTDYQMMDASQQVIKAGTNNGNGKIRLLRTAALKEDNLTLVLAIAQNDNFMPGVIDTLTVTISDRIVKPDWWDYTYNRYLGNYSKTKLLLWLEFMGVTDGSNPLDADPYIIWTDRGTGNFIYKEYRESTMMPKFMEFRQWLIKTKDNPMDPDLGAPVAQTLGTF